MRDVLDHEDFGIIPGRYSTWTEYAALTARCPLTLLNKSPRQGRQLQSGNWRRRPRIAVERSSTCDWATNNEMPHVYGEGECYTCHFDLVSIDEPLPSCNQLLQTQCQQLAADFIEPFIPDGSTLQLIGAVPDAVLSSLRAERIRCYGGMINDAVWN